MSSRSLPARVLDGALDFTVVPGYSRLGYSLRGLTWDGARAPTLGGRTALVTGASSGLGEAACEGLLAAGARVHMLVRDLERGEQARARIEARLQDASGRLEVELCDLSDLDDVRRFGAGFLARHDRLDVLVNNAGVLPAERRRTADGVELTFATNVLGPFLLTGLLLPALRLGAPVARDHRLLGWDVHGAARRRRPPARAPRHSTARASTPTPSAPRWC